MRKRKYPVYMPRCEAIVLHEHLRHPERARCSLGSTQKVKGRCFCRKHARLAREGFIDRKLRVASQYVIKTVRAAQRSFWGASNAQLRGVS